MIRLPKAERIIVSGPVGGLESILQVPEMQIEKIAVVCHPHPLYHGTMNNKVVHTLARTFQRMGAACLRFNFRGVGASAGSYDEGRGETQDALAATVFMRDRFPKANLWMAGFSFGGAVALRVARLASADLLVTVAPALHKLEAEKVTIPDCPWLLIHGDQDTTVSCRGNLEWVSQLDRPPEVYVASGVDHFFHGKLNLLRDVVIEKLENMAVV
ncbi:MAG: alpha/beta hydrolase [Proteobacteria bacterium]|nr:alpha/beta hydrolase [Pseudomonadota bacterium]